MTLSPKHVHARAAALSLQALGPEGLAEVVKACCAGHEPDASVCFDPRIDLPVVHAETRARRAEANGCVVCQDALCPAVDVAALPGDDLCWLTPNLYPAVYPYPAGADTRGVHLVQWSSTRHEGGLPGANPATAAAILRQLARTEAFLLHAWTTDGPTSGDGHHGHTCIIKNCGRRVGGSVGHDHQQVLACNLSPAEPPRTRGLRARLLADADADLVLAEVDGRALALVPRFMRRPLHAFVLPLCDDAGWLHHLDQPVLDAVAAAVAGLTGAVQAAMNANGGSAAFNLLCHAGEGCGPLFELRPATQALGGFEQLGLYVCEERPATSAARLRAAWPPSGRSSQGS